MRVLGCQASRAESGTASTSSRASATPAASRTAPFAGVTPERDVPLLLQAADQFQAYLDEDKGDGESSERLGGERANSTTSGNHDVVP